MLQGLAVKVAKGCVGCGYFNASDKSNAALASLLADDNVGVLYFFWNKSTVSHTCVADVFVNVYFPSPVIM